MSKGSPPRRFMSIAMRVRAAGKFFRRDEGYAANPRHFTGHMS